ncbi:MAG: glycosyltransferase [Ruthenibacterium lactatiformans]
MTRLWKAALPGGSTVFAGNISPAQNLPLLVECARRLKAADRRDVHFVIVGDGMSRDALEQEIAAADVADWFTFEGQHPVTDIPAYHTMADALFAALNASEDVGLTVPQNHQLLSRRASLVSVSGEAARVMDEAAAGLTSPAGDVHGLYENLLALPICRRAARLPAMRAGLLRNPFPARALLARMILCSGKKCNKPFLPRITT